MLLPDGPFLLRGESSSPGSLPLRGRGPRPPSTRFGAGRRSPGRDGPSDLRTACACAPKSRQTARFVLPIPVRHSPLEVSGLRRPRIDLDGPRSLNGRRRPRRGRYRVAREPRVSAGPTGVKEIRATPRASDVEARDPSGSCHRFSVGGSAGATTARRLHTSSRVLAIAAPIGAPGTHSAPSTRARSADYHSEHQARRDDFIGNSLNLSMIDEPRLSSHCLSMGLDVSVAPTLVQQLRPTRSAWIAMSDKPAQA
jgi:hypothetical protein